MGYMTLLLLATAVVIGVNAVDWEDTETACIQGHNAKTLHAEHIDVCKEHCVWSQHYYNIECLSIEYIPETGDCHISEHNKYSAPDYFKNPCPVQGTLYKMLKVINTQIASGLPAHSVVEWNAAEYACIQGHNAAIFGVDNIDVCKEHCVMSRQYHDAKCQSIEFFPTTKTCLISQFNRYSSPEFFYKPCQLPRNALYVEPKIKEAQFTPRVKGCINGHNMVIWRGINAHTCQLRCQFSVQYCISFEYNYRTAECCLSNLNKQTAGADYSEPCRVDINNWYYWELVADQSMN